MRKDARKHRPHSGCTDKQTHPENAHNMSRRKLTNTLPAPRAACEQCKPSLTIEDVIEMCFHLDPLLRRVDAPEFVGHVWLRRRRRCSCSSSHHHRPGLWLFRHGDARAVEARARTSALRVAPRDLQPEHGRRHGRRRGRGTVHVMHRAMVVVHASAATHPCCSAAGDTRTRRREGRKEGRKEGGERDRATTA